MIDRPNPGHPSRRKEAGGHDRSAAAFPLLLRRRCEVRAVGVGLPCEPDLSPSTCLLTPVVHPHERFVFPIVCSHSFMCGTHLTDQRSYVCSAPLFCSFWKACMVTCNSITTWLLFGPNSADEEPSGSFFRMVAPGVHSVSAGRGKAFSTPPPGGLTGSGMGIAVRCPQGVPGPESDAF